MAKVLQLVIDRHYEDEDHVHDETLQLYGGLDLYQQKWKKVGCPFKKIDNHYLMMRPTTLLLMTLRRDGRCSR